MEWHRRRYIKEGTANGAVLEEVNKGGKRQWRRKSSSSRKSRSSGSRRRGILTGAQ
jgi:hypothetical protein